MPQRIVRMWNLPRACLHTQSQPVSLSKPRKTTLYEPEPSFRLKRTNRPRGDLSITCASVTRLPAASKALCFTYCWPRLCSYSQDSRTLGLLHFFPLPLLMFRLLDLPDPDPTPNTNQSTSQPPYLMLSLLAIANASPSGSSPSSVSCSFIRQVSTSTFTAYLKCAMLLATPRSIYITSKEQGGTKTVYRFKLAEIDPQLAKQRLLPLRESRKSEYCDMIGYDVT